MPLSLEQEKLILDKWNSNSNNPPSLKDLVLLICGEGVDGRSECGREIKTFLSTRNIRAKAASDKDNKVDKIILTDEHKLYIVNNVATNTCLEIAKTIFNNSTLTNLNAETRVVNEYVKSLDTKIVYGGKEAISEVPEGEYDAPKSLDKTLKKINEYVSFVNGVQNLNAQQKKCVEKLMEYLHVYRFVRLMNTFESQYDRKSFEDSFIRYTYDKPDLTQEEIDQYIELASEIVHGISVKRRMERLGKQQDNVTANDAESQKYSMGLVEAIGKASTEYHQCRDRQKKLLEALTEKRSARISTQVEGATLLNFVQMWRAEDERKELLKIAALEQQSIADEINRISSVPDIKLRILGLSKQQILNG